MQDVNFRPATIDDSRGIAQVMLRVQRQAYRGILPDNPLTDAALQAAENHYANKFEDTLQRGGCTYVAEVVQEGIIGFAVGGPKRDGPEGYDGELYNIFVLGEYQGHKVGTALFLKVVEFLQAHQYSSLLLWSIRGTAAGGYYRHLSGENITHRVEKIANVDVTLDCYGWQSLATLHQTLINRSYPTKFLTNENRSLE